MDSVFSALISTELGKTSFKDFPMIYGLFIDSEVHGQCQTLNSDNRANFDIAHKSDDR